MTLHVFVIGTFSFIDSVVRFWKTTRILRDFATVMLRVFARLLILATAGASVTTLCR